MSRDVFEALERLLNEQEFDHTRILRGRDQIGDNVSDLDRVLRDLESRTKRGDDLESLGRLLVVVGKDLADAVEAYGEMIEGLGSDLDDSILRQGGVIATRSGLKLDRTVQELSKHF